MTAVATRNPTAMKRLAGGLAFLCLVLLLLAVEQKHTVAAWEALRDGAAGLAGQAPAAPDAPGHLAATVQGPVLAGEYGPADEATRAAVGAVTFVSAELRFDIGEHLRTRPLRIAAGSDAFTAGQTYAARLGAPAEAQIELRRVLPARRGRTAAAPSVLCGGEPAGVAALLHRGDRVDLMLFRAGPAPGPEAPPSALCGVWSFTAR